MTKARGRVSLWAGLTPSAEIDPSVDVLKEMCGLQYYDLDAVEYATSALPIELRELFERLSFSKSFAREAGFEAHAKGLGKAYWVVSVLDFEPKPEERPPNPERVKYVGAFAYGEAGEEINPAG